MRFKFKTHIIGIVIVLFSVTVFGQNTWRGVYGAFDDEKCVAVRAISENEFVAAGTTGSFGGGSSDIYLVKVNGQGEQYWSKTIGGTGIEDARDMRITDDGGMVIVGTTTQGEAGGYNGFVIRTDAEGDVLWQQIYGGDDWDFFNQVKVLENGELIIAGQTFSFGEQGGNAWLLHLTGNGEVIWDETIGGSGLHDGLSVSRTIGGAYVLCGSFVNDAGDSDGFIAKYQVSGDLDWFQAYGGDSTDIAKDIVVCQDGGFSIVGSTSSYSIHNEAWHLKVDSDGVMQWFKNWGQIGDQGSQEHLELEDGTFITIGFTKTSGGGAKDMFLLKSSETGDFMFGRTFGGFEDDEGFSIDLSGDGFIGGGYSKSFGAGSSDVFLVRTDSLGMTDSEDVMTFFDPLSDGNLEAGKEEMAIYPNPNRGEFVLDLTFRPEWVRIIEPSGKILKELKELTIGKNSCQTQLERGVYLIQALKNDGIVVTTRIIFI